MIPRGSCDYKVILLGSSTTGKSSIVVRLRHNRFDNQATPTIGASYESKSIYVQGMECTLQIWDTAGSERYRSMASVHFRGAHAAILVYDLTNRQSFEELSQWLAQLEAECLPSLVTVVIGNKLDLDEKRVVQTDEARQWAEDHHIRLFFETSALTGVNVTDAFTSLAQELLMCHPPKRVSDYGVVDVTSVRTNTREPAASECC
jgi:small GTP-binding protein